MFDYHRFIELLDIRYNHISYMWIYIHQDEDDTSASKSGSMDLLIESVTHEKNYNSLILNGDL